MTLTFARCNFPHSTNKASRARTGPESLISKCIHVWEYGSAYICALMRNYEGICEKETYLKNHICVDLYVSANVCA